MNTIKPFVKDITFFPEKYNTPAMLSRVFKAAVNSAGVLRLFAPILYSKFGSQLWVSKEVSDDLAQASITEFDFASLEWPRRNLEVIFEDPDLPSLLAQRYTQNEINAKMRELIGIPTILILILRIRSDLHLSLPNALAQLWRAYHTLTKVWMTSPETKYRQTETPEV